MPSTVPVVDMTALAVSACLVDHKPARGLWLHARLGMQGVAH